MLDLESIKARLESARAELGALCKGKRWQMSIPAQTNYDSDLLIGAALRDIPALIEEVERLRAPALSAPIVVPVRYCAECREPLDNLQGVYLMGGGTQTWEVCHRGCRGVLEARGYYKIGMAR